MGFFSGETRSKKKLLVTTLSKAAAVRSHGLTMYWNYFRRNIYIFLYFCNIYLFDQNKMFYKISRENALDAHLEKCQPLVRVRPKLKGSTNVDGATTTTTQKKCSIDQRLLIAECLLVCPFFSLQTTTVLHSSRDSEP